ncbi:MAG TPA: hypothetical protein ENH56_08715 [Roseobacter sp.]|uniref:Uncharacterized protein n=1 Tax=marine sediment metagenome TaxID=412755 RepID=A0A0F9MU87_9ZZZZ|nr:hypothetical protein [Roseobacter sp.]HEC70359.1 hypothetical protein [Roseobacter sp.]
MVWEEVDLKKRLWTILVQRMKNGKLHREPLSDAAFEILERLPRLGSADQESMALTGFWPFNRMLRCSFRIAAIRSSCSILSAETSVSGHCCLCVWVVRCPLRKEHVNVNHY